MTTEQLLAEFAFNCNLAIALIVGIFLFSIATVSVGKFIKNIPNLYRKFKVRFNYTETYTTDKVSEILNKNIAPIEYRAKYHFGLKYVKSVKISQSAPNIISLNITGEQYNSIIDRKSTIYGYILLPTKNDKVNLYLFIWLTINDSISVNNFKNFLNSIKTILNPEEKK